LDFICNRSNLLGTKVGKHQIIKDRLLQRLPKIWFPEKKEKEEGKYNFIKTSYDISLDSQISLFSRGFSLDITFLFLDVHG